MPMRIKAVLLLPVVMWLGAASVHAQANPVSQSQVDATTPSTESAPAAALTPPATPAAVPAEAPPPAPQQAPSPPTAAAPPPASRAGGTTDIVDVPEDEAVPAAGVSTNVSRDLTPGAGETTAAVDTRFRGANAAHTAGAPDSVEEANHLPWIFAGVAVVLGMSGAVVGLDAINKYDQLEKNCARPCSEARIDALTARSLTADLLYVGAGASLVTAIVLFALEDSSHDTKSKSTNAQATRALSVTPLVEVGRYGVHGQLRF